MPELEQPLPRYLQIAGGIRDRILRGDLRPGDEVPSERQIAATWGVSRPTAGKALDVLRQEGLVESRRGSGSYVRNTHDLHRRARERYQKAADTGLIYPPDEHARITAAALVDAPDHVTDALRLPSPPRAVLRTRLILRDRLPVELSTSWYPAHVADVAPRLLVRDRIREGTLSYVEGVTGRRARHAHDRVSARLATAGEAAALGLPEPAAVLVVRHLVYDLDDRPLEFAEAVYPPGAWSYEERYKIHSG